MIRIEIEELKRTIQEYEEDASGLHQAIQGLRFYFSF